MGGVDKMLLFDEKELLGEGEVEEKGKGREDDKPEIRVGREEEVVERELEIKVEDGKVVEARIRNRHNALNILLIISIVLVASVIIIFAYKSSVNKIHSEPETPVIEDYPVEPVEPVEPEKVNPEDMPGYIYRYEEDTSYLEGYNKSDEVEGWPSRGLEEYN